ncbi:hypothetical protein MBLNU457_1509t1 [Dothideomycetes sp. NU457]
MERPGQQEQTHDQSGGYFDQNEPHAKVRGQRKYQSETQDQELVDDLPYESPMEYRPKPNDQPVASTRSSYNTANTHRVREPQAALHVPKTTRSNVPPELRYDRGNDYANATDIPSQSNTRRGSIPERSPLQKLEGRFGGLSKEEKRARMEEAENRARHRAIRDGGARGLTDPTHRQGQSRRSTEEQENSGAAPRHMRNDKRHSSAPSDQKADIPYSQDTRPTTSETPASNGNSKFHNASEALRAHRNSLRDTDLEKQEDAPDTHLQQSSQPKEDTALRRSNSVKYRHRARHAGFAGAEAAFAAAGITSDLDGAGKREDKKRSFDQGRPDEGKISRSNSRRIQKKNVPAEYQTGNRDPSRVPESQQQLQAHRVGLKEGIKAAAKHQDPDPLPPSAVKNPRSGGPEYQVPPQTAAGQDARDRVAFDSSQQSTAPEERHHHRFTGAFQRSHNEPQAHSYRPTAPLEEWRSAGIAKLELNDLAVDDAVTGRWEGGRERRSSGPRNGPSAYDGSYEEEATAFKPPLFLRCGPLLRYTGLRRERRAVPGSNSIAEREVWRGSIMIVTEDSHSSYERPPTLRLFAQPMDILPPPPTKVTGQLPSEHVDPLAGQVKVSRTGQPLYVRPADALEEGVDLSRIEDDTGLFERTKAPILGPQQTVGSDGKRYSHITTKQSRIRSKDGEKAGKYREVRGARLHAERGLTFWRFQLEIELGLSQARIAYRINRGPAVGFWVPGRGQTMNIMFHSCNGFSMSVDPNLFSGPDPLWRDVLTMHQSRPFHVMLGGGDQIYNDAAMRDTEHFREWLAIKNPEHKHRVEFSSEMQEELESFYLNRYCTWFSQGLFSMANSQIPMINMWDDHDIIDGYGSYPHHFMGSKVFTGLGAVAFKYYMLFQHQSVVAETSREEPSWLLGASPGPYINEYSRSIFTHLGRKVAFLGVDCRTERMRDEVLSQESYDIIFSRCRGEIIKGETKHLIVLLGIPIAYPRLNFLENILTSRVMDPVKAVVGKTGLLGGFINKFDGGIEILDDLDDHWTAKHHKQERNWFVQELQELAAEKSVRITILGGDVHLAAVGQFYSPKKFGIPKDQDHRYMPNIVSSAIVNTPPPVMMGDILNKRNKVHHLDAETDEDMIPMFDYDVDGRPRKNHHLLPRRNYCTIREYVPGSTPPASPEPDDRPSSSRSLNQQSGDHLDERDQRYPPGSMDRRPAPRSRSLTRDSFRPANLMRRLSGSRSRQEQAPLGPDDSKAYEDIEPVQHRAGMGGSSRAQDDEGDYTSQQRVTATDTSANANVNTKPVRPVSMFHRRPTDLSHKAASQAAARGGADANVDGYDGNHIDLRYGLDVTLNMEIDQHDPSGNTVGYRLLVPALHYSGLQDENTTRFKTRRASLMDRIWGRDLNRKQSFDSYSGDSRSPSPENRNAVKSVAVGRQTGTVPQANPKIVPHNDQGQTSPYNAQARSQSQAPQDARGPYPEGFNEEPKDFGSRPSFMDRIRGRRKNRRQSFDSYSGDSRSPSPEVRNAGDRPTTAGRQAEVPHEMTRRDGPYNAQPRYTDGSSDPRKEYGRRPSFMDRIRGRAQSRRRGFDSYSGDSRSPSPDNRNGRTAPVSSSGPRDTYEETARANVLQDARAPYNDRSTDVRRNRGPPQPMHNQTDRNPSASNDGAPAVPEPPQEDEDIPQRPRKRFNFPSFRRKKTAGEEDEGHGRERYGEESEDDVPEDEMTWSEAESLEARQRQRQRRPSKAERFFGVGNEKMWGNSGTPGDKQEMKNEKPKEATWRTWR